MKESAPGLLLLSNLLILPVAVVVFQIGCCRFALLLLPFFREGVVTFSAAVVKIGSGVVSVLTFADIKKEPSESPCSPKALDFKPFSHFDNSIFSYHFLVLYFYLIAHFDTILFSLHFFILPPKGVQMEKQAKIQ